MRIRATSVAVSALAIAGFGLAANAQPTPASSRCDIAVVYKRER